MRTALLCGFFLVLSATVGTGADEPIFSGPQVGEKLTPFKVRGVLDPHAGKDIDFIEMAKEGPVVLVFVHDLNRQSLSMTRVLTSYAKTRAKDGLTTGVVWLSDDATEAENTIKKVKHALTEGVPIGVSPDGREGPGKYGLNRKVMLTILVGNKNKVTANFALVQPSLQADLPKVLEAVVKEVGGKVPKLEEIEGMPKVKDAPKQDPNLRGLLTPVIKLTATPEEVEKAAKALEEYLAKNEATRAEVGRICNTIIDNGKLTDYGTPKAQEYLKKWAKEYGKKEEPKRKEDPKKEKP